MLIGGLLYYSTVTLVATIFDHCWSDGQECGLSDSDHVAVSPAVSAADFWPWAKKQLMEVIENGNIDHSKDDQNGD